MDGTRHGHSRTILHMDMDCFYAQVEMILNPSLRDKPLGIQQKTILATTNYVARARGVAKMCRISEAKKVCPEIVIVNGEVLTKYRKASEDIFQVVRSVLPSCPAQRLGLDEIFVDISSVVSGVLAGDGTALRLRQGPGISALGSPPCLRLPLPSAPWQGHVERADPVDPEDELLPECACGCTERLCVGTNIGAELKRLIKDTLGFTSCVGIAHNKVLAKVGGSLHKPDQQTCVLPEAAMRVLSPSLVRKIPNIGRAAARALAELQVLSAHDVRGKDLAFLTEHLGEKTGTLVYELVRGIDDTEVTLSGAPKTLSNEDNVGHCSDLPTLASRLEPLVARLLDRVDQEQLENDRIPRTLRMSICGKSYFKRRSKQTSLPASLLMRPCKAQRAEELMDLCMRLVGELVKPPFLVTVVNVGVTNFNDRANSAPSLARFLVRKEEEDEGHDAPPRKVASAHPAEPEDEQWWDEDGEEGSLENCEDEGELISSTEHDIVGSATSGQGTGAFLLRDADAGTLEDGLDGTCMRCSLCGAAVPGFCWDAHERYHEMGEDAF